jgi:hypothetical protein
VCTCIWDRLSHKGDISIILIDPFTYLCGVSLALATENNIKIEMSLSKYSQFLIIGVFEDYFEFGGLIVIIINCTLENGITTRNISSFFNNFFL